MNIFINGCSYTEKRQGINVTPDQHTWSQVIEQRYPEHIFDIWARAAAGNRYICESTLEYLETNNPDLVMIMWSGLGRQDHVITNEELAILQTPPRRYVGTIKHGNVPWVFSGGVWDIHDSYYLEESGIPAILRKYYTNFSLYDNVPERIKSSLDYMIKLQTVLSERNIPYIFMSYQNYWNKTYWEVLKTKLNVDVRDRFSFNTGGNAYICDYPELEKYATAHIDFSKWCFCSENNMCVFELALTEFPERTGTYDDGDHPGANANNILLDRYLLPKLAEVHNIIL